MKNHRKSLIRVSGILAKSASAKKLMLHILSNNSIWRIFFRKLNQSFLLLKKDRIDGIDEEMEEEAKLEEDSRAAKLKT